MQLKAEEFTVAAFNVDGMPRSINVAGIKVDLNPDAKEAAGATAIGQKLKTEDWDIVAASEDFNYHSQIWDAAWNGGVNDGGFSSFNSTTHRGNISVTAEALARFIAQQSPVFDIDGLCLFYRWNRVTPSNESWTSWNAHNGFTDDGADGMIDKGYRYYLVTLDTGEQVDVYILHMDAETSDADNAARDVQLKQLADAIIATHNGRPVVVLGDTNCRYTRDYIKDHFIDRIEADGRFTVRDAYIQRVLGGLYPVVGANAIMDQGSIAANRQTHGYDYGEVVDKVFYINSKESGKRLSLVSYKMDYSFKNDEGEPLADHWPIVVKLDIHDYDPAIDDDPQPDPLLSGEYYIRNLSNGYFLKQGGKYDTHAVTGTYGSLMKLVHVSGGKYAIQSPIGNLKLGDPWMDDSGQNLWYVSQAIGKTKSYFIYYDEGTVKRALASNSLRSYPYGPNYASVTVSTFNASSSLQKWELLTKEQLMTEMREKASEATPYECTFLLSGANFDNKDGGKSAWSGWPAGATKMTYNDCGGVYDDRLTNGNPCAEVYCQSYGGWTDYGTTWEVGQTLTGLPDGKYKVTMQGFYRDGDMNQNNPGTLHAWLYARSGGVEEKVQLQSLYNAQRAAAIGNVTTKDKDGYYIPNGMEDATYFFNAGYYENGVTVTVTGGTLTVAVGKPVKTKSTSGWTCFDNFRLFYLGDPSYDGVGSIGEAKEPDGRSERKILENGRIVIVKEGVRYNTAGQQVR